MAIGIDPELMKIILGDKKALDVLLTPSEGPTFADMVRHVKAGSGPARPSSTFPLSWEEDESYKSKWESEYLTTRSPKKRHDSYTGSAPSKMWIDECASLDFDVDPAVFVQGALGSLAVNKMFNGRTSADPTEYRVDVRLDPLPDHRRLQTSVRIHIKDRYEGCPFTATMEMGQIEPGSNAARVNSHSDLMRATRNLLVRCNGFYSLKVTLHDRPSEPEVELQVGKRLADLAINNIAKAFHGMMRKAIDDVERRRIEGISEPLVSIMMEGAMMQAAEACEKQWKGAREHLADRKYLLEGMRADREYEHFRANISQRVVTSEKQAPPAPVKPPEQGAW